MVQYGGSGVAKREEGGKSSDVTLHEGKFMDEVTHRKVLNEKLMKNSYISMKSGPIRTKRIEDCVLKSQLAGGRLGGCIQSAAQELNPW